MLSQPFLKMGELHGSWLLQCTRSEPANPVVVNPQGLCYGSMLAYGGFNRFASFFDSFFDIHAFHMLTL